MPQAQRAQLLRAPNSCTKTESSYSKSMTEYTKSCLYSPEGDEVWSGPYEKRSECLKLVRDLPQFRILSRLCGEGQEYPECNPHEILKVATELGFLSREGCVKGFYNILPAGTFLESIMEAFNRTHREEFAANRIDFPTLFDKSSPEITSLTESYEKQWRMFRLEEEGQLRLSYAADPNLFSWLQGKRLKQDQLPYTIYSPHYAFRRAYSGQLGGLKNFRQYLIPDMHIFCTEDSSLDLYLKYVNQGGQGVSFWLGDDWGQFIDLASDSEDRYLALGSNAARTAKQFTLLNIMKERPRYYAFRGGLMGDAGCMPLMLYNLQLDDTNARRFDIGTNAQSDLHIIHATLLSGCPKILPLLIGRGLAGLSNKALPVELAPVQISILPVHQSHCSLASSLHTQLTDEGLRVDILEPESPLSSRIKILHESWTPYFIVVGDKEVQDENYRIQSRTNDEELSLDDFRERFHARIEKCRPAENRIPSPPPF